MTINVRTEGLQPTSAQLTQSPARSVQPPDSAAVLYLTSTDVSFIGTSTIGTVPEVGLSTAEKNYIVGQLDSADKLAGLSFLCLREGDYQRATEYMQEATDIRKSVEPKLTESQKQSLEKIMSLQQDAFSQLQDHSWFGSIFGQIRATIDLSQASQESQKLRNSVLSSGQLAAIA